MRKTLLALSKNLLIKGLIILIIGVFALWGIGDLFSSGKTNVVAEVSGKNIYTQEFVDQLKREMQIQNILNGKEVIANNLHFKILNKLVADKIIEIYAEDEKIIINDKTLASYLKEIPEFKEKNEFSRTKYEKYLLQNSSTTSEFEKNFRNNLLRKLIIDSQASSTLSTNYHQKLIKEYFTKQTQIKYINLNELYSIEVPSDSQIQEYYKKNPLYSDQYRSIKYSLLKPNNNEKENIDQFFKKISLIENDVLSNKNYNEIVDKYSLISKKSGLFNKEGFEKNLDKKIFLDGKIVEKAFSLEGDISSELIEIQDSYYLISVNIIEDIKPLQLDGKTKKIISNKIRDLELLNKIGELKKNIQDKKIFDELAIKNKNLVKDLFLKSRLEKSTIFNGTNIQNIFDLNENDLTIIEDKNNYIIKVTNISYDNKKIDNNTTKLYERYASNNFKDQIMMSFDKFLNSKYEIKINQKVLDRIINSL